MDPEAIDEFGRTGGGPRVPHGSADDPQRLDFSANTNPRTPPGTAAVYEAALAASRSYPAEDYEEFRAAVADYVGCDAGEVVPTAGGMAAIRLAVATHVGRGDGALVPAPTFGEYAREVRLQGGEPEFVPAADLLETEPAPYALAIACQPNNPTGRAADPDRLRAFAARCRDAGTLLLVDEAFIDLTDLDSVAAVPGTVVARSLTKAFGLPGLRMGYAVATGTPLDRLEAARPTWGLSVPAAAVGTHCLDQEEFRAATRRRVRRERDRMAERLAARFDVAPSEAPFLLLATDSPAAVDDVLRTAKEAGIVIRDARTFRGLDRHFRVAVRLPAENDRLLEALHV